MKKSNKASRYQRQFGKGGNNSSGQEKSEDATIVEEAAARRRVRQEQGEIIDQRFGYHRLEDQYQERKNSSSATREGLDELAQRRGWLFNMAATTVRE